DVAPTVAAVMGVEGAHDWEGASLLLPVPRIARAFVDHTVHELALIDGPWKALVDVDAGRTKLFRLDVDPEERVDVAIGDPTRVAGYRAQLEAWAALSRSKLVH